MAAHDDLNVATVRESFGRVVYSHKIHEKAREIESAKTVATKWFNIVLTAATAGSIFSALITDEHVLLIISAVVSTLAVAFVVFQLSFDPGEAEERHRATAKQLWLIREQYQLLLVDMMEGQVERHLLLARRDQLVADLERVYSQAPSTSPRAYKRAQTALKVSEDMTFSDEEIDRFLPTALHTATGRP
jgi:hypothetical protein